MKVNQQEGLTLNGRWYARESLSDHSEMINKEQDPLIAGILGFLMQWFNSNDSIFLQTSGSTGPPKKILLPKKSMQASALMTGNFFGLKPGMSAHLCLSPDFVAGKMMIVRALILNLDLVTTTIDSNPLQMLSRPLDFSAMVPLQVAQTLKLNPEKLNLIKTLIIGGGGVSPELEDALQGAKTACWHTYGMTETLSHVALRPINGSKSSSWFTPMPGVNIDTDERSCLIIDAPALNAQKVVTNDIVTLRGNQFQVTGRYDQVIISGGFKLHPLTIERKLSKTIPHPFFIAGIPHPGAGQISVLFIEGIVSAEQIIRMQKEIAGLLPSHEIPREIRVLGKFEYLASGKIDRLATIAGYK